MTDTVPEASADADPAAPAGRRRARAPPSGARSRACSGSCSPCCLPQLHRQALLHPVGIDDAGPAEGRPAGGQQISLWLVLGVARASTSSRIGTGACSASCRERGDIVIVTPPGQSDDYIKRVIGLPGDTIEVRGRPADPQRQAGDSPSCAPPAMIPVDANVPCGIEFSGFQVMSRDGKAYCRLPIVRETLPERRRPTTRSTSARARATISGRSRSRPTICS